MNVTDDELIQELSNRFAQSRKAFTDLNVVNRKLVEMNRKLELSESLKSNFLSNIRNEINNPLSLIMGMSGQLAVLGADNPDIATLASLIGAEANGLDFQLRNIFMAAELEAGEVSPHFTRVRMSEMLTNLIESFCYGAAKKQVLLDLKVPSAEEPVDMVTDIEKVQIIVSNLLANAIEFSRDGGTVEIAFDVACDGKLLFAVRDFGAGISPENQQRIFDRFVQLETGTTRTHQGHGLGLCITKALVDLLQGSISLDSIPGEGTLFSVILPPGPLSDLENTFYEGGTLFHLDDSGKA